MTRANGEHSSPITHQASLVSEPVDEPLIFEISTKGRTSQQIGASDVPGQPIEELLPKGSLRSAPPDLPELTEGEVVRHYTHLSKKNYSIDSGFYPLGSCTMKYNPRVHERVAALPGFAQIHPYQPERTVQGALELLYHTQSYLAEISGLDAASLQPAAGAHGELAGVLMVHAYHRDRGDHERRTVLIPDSAHGTNPATAAMCGFDVVTLKSDKRGGVDMDDLRRLANDRVACVMITIPSTLGLFDDNILEITDIVHRCGGLVYCDGANMNAMLGQAKLGQLGADVMHFNVHKTFSQPHGGGGPGGGPVAVKALLEPFLPTPMVAKRATEGGDVYYFDYDRPKSIGKVRSFAGQFGVMVRGFTYIRSLGAEGLEAASENAVLNANYLMNKVKDYYDLPYDRTCMHEFVASGRRLKEHGVKTLDLAKRLIDYGFHPPTIYFPLIVDEAIMVEPTETESRTALDAFADALIRIAKEAEESPDLILNAPTTAPVRRLDETRAARQPNLRWRRT